MLRTIHPNARKQQRLERRESDPSEEEIAALCQQIQETWSERERVARKFHYVIELPYDGKSDAEDRRLDTSLARPNMSELVRLGLVSQ